MSQPKTGRTRADRAHIVKIRDDGLVDVRIEYTNIRMRVNAKHIKH